MINLSARLGSIFCIMEFYSRQPTRTCEIGLKMFLLIGDYLKLSIRSSFLLLETHRWHKRFLTILQLFAQVIPSQTSLKGKKKCLFANLTDNLDTSQLYKAMIALEAAAFRLKRQFHQSTIDQLDLAVLKSR